MNDKELNKTLDFPTPHGTYADEIARAHGLDLSSPTLREDVKQKLSELNARGVSEETLTITDEDEITLDRIWTE